MLRVARFIRERSLSQPGMVTCEGPLLAGLVAVLVVGLVGGCGGLVGPPTPEAPTGPAPVVEAAGPAGELATRGPVAEITAPDVAQQAETIARRMMDSEALYTVVGGLKPLSSGFWTLRLQAANPPAAGLRELRLARQAMASWPLGEDLVAGVYTFARTYDGKRHYHAFVASRRSVAAAVARWGEFFARYGLTPESHPWEILLSVENIADSADRARGYGYLYGYPAGAVEFFANAEVQRRQTGELVPRDFVHIPTYGASQHRFVWAVPRGHKPDQDQERIRQAAEPILEDYRQRRRAAGIDEGRTGAVELLKAWLIERGEIQPAFPEAAKHQGETG